MPLLQTPPARRARPPPLTPPLILFPRNDSGDVLGLLLPLGIPLAGLQDQDADQDKRQDGVARAQHLEGVLPPQNHLARQGSVVRDAPELGVRVPGAGRDGAHALDDVGDVDAHADDVQDQGGAVEEHVGLAGAEELDEEAEEADRDDDVEEAPDQGGRLVDEAEVRLELVVVRGRDGVRGPEEGEVVGEGGEEDAEEEADGCFVVCVEVSKILYDDEEICFGKR